jgi:hypothetical protein
MYTYPYLRSHSSLVAVGWLLLVQNAHLDDHDGDDYDDYDDDNAINFDIIKINCKQNT